MNNYDDRDNEQDWPEEDGRSRADQGIPEPPEPPEREDDAAQLPIRRHNRRRQQAQRRGTYRPPSELDHE